MFTGRRPLRWTPEYQAPPEMPRSPCFAACMEWEPFTHLQRKRMYLQERMHGLSGSSAGMRVESGNMPPEKAGTPLRVLMAEDNPGDILLMRAALDACFPKIEVSVQEDGEEMMRWIDKLDRGEALRPDVILLDLNLPRVTGEEVLWRLGQSRLCRGVPTVVVTSSDSARDRTTTAGLGASRYFRKPIDYYEFMRLGSLVKAVLTSAAGARS